MAKEDKDRMVRVKVKKAICWGGQVVRPKVDGKNITPVEAVIPESEAKLHGSDYVEVLGEVEVTPDNKQVTGGVKK